MILRILKSNRSVNYFLYPLLGVIFWLQSFLKPQIYPFYSGEAEGLLYNPIARLVADNALSQSIIALVLLLIMAFMVQQINNQYSFIRIRTMLPAPIFVIIISGFTQLHTLHPVYFGSIFLLVAIYRLFVAFDKSKPYSAAFDTGFILGIGTLFYYNLFIILPALIIGVGILARENNWRQFVLMLLGFLLPLVFAAAYAFLTNNLLEFLKTFEQSILTPNNHFKSNISLHIYLGSLIVLTVFGSVKIIQQYDTKKVSTRKYFSVFFLIFIFSLLSFTFIPATSQEMLMITAIPLTFLIANFFVFLKSRFWGELLFSLLFVLVLVLQFLAWPAV